MDRKQYMKKLKVQILKCSTGHHNGLRGTIESQRLDGNYNVRLQSKQMCVAIHTRNLEHKVGETPVPSWNIFHLAHQNWLRLMFQF